MTEIAWPKLAFNMFQAGTRDGVLLANGAFKNFFGAENYEVFRKVGKTGGYIGAEDMQRVDREVYARVVQMVGIEVDRGETLLKQK